MQFIEIQPIPALKDNYIWAIFNRDTREAWIIDPGDATAVFDFLRLQNLDLVGILVTHRHWDHVNGIEPLTAKFDVPVIGPLKDNISQLTRGITNNDLLTFDQLPITFKVFEIPGHTKGHIAYYSPGMLFCGDTLFAAGCGRIFEGSPEELYASLQMLVSLHDATKIFCAHEYTLNNLKFAILVEPDNSDIEERLAKISKMRQDDLITLPSTILEEKLTNPFLRCHASTLIKNVERHVNRELKTPLEVFTELRKWKDTFG